MGGRTRAEPQHCSHHAPRGARYWGAFAGKWDIGFATQGHIPAGRGYASSLGYFFQINDYCMSDHCPLEPTPSACGGCWLRGWGTAVYGACCSSFACWEPCHRSTASSLPPQSLQHLSSRDGCRRRRNPLGTQGMIGSEGHSCPNGRVDLWKDQPLTRLSFC